MGRLTACTKASGYLVVMQASGGLIDGSRLVKTKEERCEGGCGNLVVEDEAA